jgi:hypothetical protein
MTDLLDIDTDGAAKKGFVFDIDYMIEDVAPSKNQYGDDGSVKTFRDECVEIPDSEDDGSMVGMGEDDSSATGIQEHRSPSPDSLIIQPDSATQATSTMTEDPSDVAAYLEQMMLKNPELLQQLYLKNSQKLSSLTTAVSPTEGVDGN